MEPALTVEPEEIKTHPAPDAQAQPEWVRAVLAYAKEAAEAGEVVSITRKPLMLTPAEAADRLGMSRPTISRRIAAGELRTVKVGNRHRIPIQEFERFRDSLFGSMIAQTSDDIEADLYGA